MYRLVSLGIYHMEAFSCNGNFTTSFLVPQLQVPRTCYSPRDINPCVINWEESKKRCYYVDPVLYYQPFPEIFILWNSASNITENMVHYVMDVGSKNLYKSLKQVDLCCFLCITRGPHSYKWNQKSVKLYLEQIFCNYSSIFLFPRMKHTTR